MKVISGDALIEILQDRLGDKVLGGRVEHRTAGAARKEYDVVWLSLHRDGLVPAVQVMKEIDYPFLSVLSAYDAGAEIAVVYHFTLFVTSRGQALFVQAEVRVAKDDPWLPTLTGEITGAVTTEQEKREMIGVQFRGLAPMENIFLPKEFPAGVYPWRKDESGLEAYRKAGTGGER